MRAFRSTRSAAVAAGLLLVLCAPVAAQSDTLLLLQSGSPTGNRLVVDSAGGFVALGTLDRGTIPATGAGVRLMWYPRRAAFRAGRVMGTQWDDGSVGPYSTAMGSNTTASGWYSTAMGEGSTASGSHSTAMGVSTTASRPNSTAMGAFTTASGHYSTAMGAFTTASGNHSTAMGAYTTAAGFLSTAMGTLARAGHTGSFVWGSTTTAGAFPSDSIVSSAIGEFSVRAVGGVRMFTNLAMTSGMTMSAGGSTWNAVSDRARKENFAPVDGEDVLLRLRSVPVTSWNYVAEGREVRHIGPMAQDWHAAFALNDDPLTINQGDFDGVNLAGVKALDERTERQAERIRTLEAENAVQAELLRTLQTDIAELRALLRERAKQHPLP